MKFVLVLVVLVLAGSAAAAPGCPPGTKYQCMQGKGRVVCSCHRKSGTGDARPGTGAASPVFH
jgi:hypothetical protein